MKTQLSVIREKLELYNKRYIDDQMLKKIIEKFAPNQNTSYLTGNNLITPIKRGKYYLNNRSKDFVDPFIVGSLYFKDENYYAFGGISAYNKYSLSTQIPEWYTIYNSKISGRKIIGNTKFIFVRQRESFFYGIDINLINGFEYKIISKERAIIELLKEGKIITSIPEGVNKEKLLKIARENSSKNIILQIEKLCF